MKDCGAHFHSAVCSKSMMHEMKRLIKKYWGRKGSFESTSPIGNLAALMLQHWTNTLPRRTYPHYGEAYFRLCEKGIHFPSPTSGHSEPISEVPKHPNLKPKESPSQKTSSSSHIPKNVLETLDATGESLGLLFSITEDPNAPIPEDLLNPIVETLKQQSKTIADLINANMENENAVRRLLEVNDQIDAALKRIKHHKNILDDDSDTDSDAAETMTASSKSKSTKSRSSSTAGASASRSPARTDSTSKTRSASAAAFSHSNYLPPGASPKSSLSNAAQLALLDFLGPSAAPVQQKYAPPSASTSSTAKGSFDAFDFNSSFSAFAPMSGASNGFGSGSNGSSSVAVSDQWATFPGQSPQSFSPTSPPSSSTALAPNSLLPGAQHGSNGSALANGNGATPFDPFFSPKPPHSAVGPSFPFSSPSTFPADAFAPPTPATQANNASTSLFQVSPSMVQLHQQSPPIMTNPSPVSSAAAPNSPAFNPFDTPSAPRQTTAPNSQHTASFPSPDPTSPLSPNNARLANTFGKFWAGDSNSSSSAPQPAPTGTLSRPNVASNSSVNVTVAAAHSSPTLSNGTAQHHVPADPFASTFAPVGTPAAISTYGTTYSMMVATSQPSFSDYLTSSHIPSTTQRAVSVPTGPPPSSQHKAVAPNPFM